MSDGNANIVTNDGRPLEKSRPKVAGSIIGASETGILFFVLLRIALKVIEDKPRREYLERQGNSTLPVSKRNATSVARSLRLRRM